MGKNYAMGGGVTKTSREITEADPWTNLFDDGSHGPLVYNTKEEAESEVPPKWRAGTKQVRVSELPPEQTNNRVDD